MLISQALASCTKDIWISVCVCSVLQARRAALVPQAPPDASCTKAL